MASGFVVELRPVGWLAEGALAYWEMLAPQAASEGVTQGEAAILVGLCQALALRDEVARALEEHGLLLETGAKGFKRSGLGEDLMRANRQVADALNELALTRAGRMRLTELAGKKRLDDEAARAPSNDAWDEALRLQ